MNRFAARVAAHLGTEHRELKIGATDVLAVLPEVVRRLDEPFADNSLLPRFAVAKLARQDVTVANVRRRRRRAVRRLPAVFLGRSHRDAAAAFVPAHGADGGGPVWRRSGGSLEWAINALTAGKYSGAGGLGGRVRRFAEYLRVDAAASFDRMRSAWTADEPIVVGVSPRDPASIQVPTV